MFDVSFGKCTPTISPKVSDLVAKIIDDLEMLNGTEAQIVTAMATEDVEMETTTADTSSSAHENTSSDVEMVDVNAEEETRKRAVRIAKTGECFV